MTDPFDHRMWHLLGRALLVATVGIAWMGGGTEAWAQAEDDTSRAAPTGVEPAGLDSLPTGETVPPPTPVQPASDTSDPPRAFVNADSLIRREKRVQDLYGDVFVRQDSTRLRSDYARRYLSRSELLFTDNVVIYERGDTLRADTVRYDRATEVGYARGNVRLTNGEVNVRADSARYFASEKRSVFPDSVVLVDGDRVLRAQRGTYWSDEGRAEFGGRVRLTEPGTTLLSDSLTYYRDRDRSVAYGNVFIDRRGDDGADADTTARTYLFGNRADNREARRYSRVEGDALLVRVRMDSTGAPSDTLVVAARRLEAFRTDMRRRLVAVDSVRIWQPDLSATADSAVYDRVVATTPDSVAGRRPPIDTTRPPPDSVAPQAGSDSLRAAAPTASPPVPSQKQATAPPDSTGGRDRPVPDTSARSAAVGPSGRSSPTARRGARGAPAPASRRWDTPTARADSALPIEETRLFRSPTTWFDDSQVWGDSIRVRARNRRPDTVFVRGAGFAAQRDSVLDRIQQLKAETITAFFEEGTLHRIRARPNARAIRFLAAENDSLNGAARTSGDRIELRFVDGSVRRVSVIGGTQTTYYRNSENIPDPFQLEGFQWTPARRPIRGELLRDARVRRRLGRGPARRDRPVAGPVPPSGAEGTWAFGADSTAQTGTEPPYPADPMPVYLRQGMVPERSSSDSTDRGPAVPPDSLRSPPPSDTLRTMPSPDS
ncbi:OstA-like protein [Salinibacter ruber]|jgi:lipopolysaccharide export system protein LptA|uniref:Lipopolysaccharide export system protein LptA n=1 Tax=Salinibacter ruber TaxID=146919 RepID=A0A9X2V480_9BACT|nr:OstA-like protein [Salinibacter ruber]MCS3644100.1 lipopolysaccharide export system protein LptA [Salinibacter ruber]MCS3659511.1 lipopolysaccharide export system protein LptA [Salinibacter ruber]MCS3682881.1 lipopolysaccharide export system protein LptA [Salinibacter ruber]MCS3708897.1 lipopolysaccharide export system protein LptA [Salinibacter ruber]MCS4087444.1 lipopolysaccharide export system protein LptA [Salinibacter ruber]